jgi:hypothetical protein
MVCPIAFPLRPFICPMRSTVPARSSVDNHHPGFRIAAARVPNGRTREWKTDRFLFPVGAPKRAYPLWYFFRQPALAVPRRGTACASVAIATAYLALLLLRSGVSGNDPEGSQRSDGILGAQNV